MTTATCSSNYQNYLFFPKYQHCLTIFGETEHTCIGRSFLLEATLSFFISQLGDIFSQLGNYFFPVRKYFFLLVYIFLSIRKYIFLLGKLRGRSIGKLSGHCVWLHRSTTMQIHVVWLCKFMSYDYTIPCRTTIQSHVVRLYHLMSYDYTTSCCTTIPPHVVRHEDLIKKRLHVVRHEASWNCFNSIAWIVFCRTGKRVATQE